MGTLLQICYLLVALVVGLAIIYGIRYAKDTGRWMEAKARLYGIIKFMMLVTIIVGVGSSQELDVDDEIDIEPLVVVDEKPVMNPFIPSAAKTISDGVNYYVQQELVDEKNYLFLWDDTNLTITFLNNSTELFYA